MKQATKTCNLFCNIAAKWVEQRCCAFYRLHSNLLQVAWVLTPDWIKLHESDVTCCKASLPWAGNWHATCTDFVAKSRTSLCFPQHFFASSNNLICCKTDGKTLNMQQCFKTSRTFSLPVLPYLYGWNNIKITYISSSFVCTVLKFLKPGLRNHSGKILEGSLSLNTGSCCSCDGCGCNRLNSRPTLKWQLTMPKSIVVVIKMTKEWHFVVSEATIVRL